MMLDKVSGVSEEVYRKMLQDKFCVSFSVVVAMLGYGNGYDQRNSN